MESQDERVSETTEFSVSVYTRQIDLLTDDPRPKIITLCGSTRFHEEFVRVNYELTMAGAIVLSVGFYSHAEPETWLARATHGEDVGVTPEQKEQLDALHKRKIDLSDEIFVLNVGGYIGDSTRSEIRHAEVRGIHVRYLEPRAQTWPVQTSTDDIGSGDGWG